MSEDNAGVPEPERSVGDTGELSDAAQEKVVTSPDEAAAAPQDAQADNVPSPTKDESQPAPVEVNVNQASPEPVDVGQGPPPAGGDQGPENPEVDEVDDTNEANESDDNVEAPQPEQPSDDGQQEVDQN